MPEIIAKCVLCSEPMTPKARVLLACFGLWGMTGRALTSEELTLDDIAEKIGSYRQRVSISLRELVKLQLVEVTNGYSARGGGVKKTYKLSSRVLGAQLPQTFLDVVDLPSSVTQPMPLNIEAIATSRPMSHPEQFLLTVMASQYPASPLGLLLAVVDCASVWGVSSSELLLRLKQLFAKYPEGCWWEAFKKRVSSDVTWLLSQTKLVESLCCPGTDWSDVARPTKSPFWMLNSCFGDFYVGPATAGAGFDAKGVPTRRLLLWLEAAVTQGLKHEKGLSWFSRSKEPFGDAFAHFGGREPPYLRSLFGDFSKVVLGRYPELRRSRVVDKERILVVPIFLQHGLAYQLGLVTLVEAANGIEGVESESPEAADQAS